MPAKVDRTGQIFGRLTVLSRALGRSVWLCRCDCGIEKEVRSDSLVAGKTKSCGCITGESHGMAETPEYHVFEQMKNRCYNENSDNFKNYGGRGISICDEWKNSFITFFAYVGPRPSPLHSIDRIDNDGNYEPGNVRWATKVEQNNNTRRNLHKRPKYE